MAPGVTGMTRNGWKLPPPSRAVVMVLAWAAIGAAPAPGDPAVPQVAPDHAKKMELGLEIFRKDVRALLTDHCIKCHGGASTKAEFDLTTREGLLRGGASGPAVVPGKAGESLLYQLIAHAEEPHMPLKAKKLPDEAIARIGAWIDAGAPYDGPLVGKDGAIGAKEVGEEDRQFWSFRPLGNPEPPKVRDEELVPHPRRPVHPRPPRGQGLAPGRPADRRTLIRRASFDLIGLPPTPEEVEAFVADPSPDAYETLVDRLLASPALRRALGAALARPGPVRREPRLRAGLRPARRLPLPRLRHPGAQRRHAVRPVRPAGRSPATSSTPSDPLAMMATGFLAAGTHADADHRQPGREGAVRRARRHDGHRRHGDPRPDDRLRPLPRPQVRPDPAGRLLPAALDVHHDRPQRDRPRPRPRTDPPREARVRPPARRRWSKPWPSTRRRSSPGACPDRSARETTVAWPRRLVRDPVRARSWTEPLLDALRAAYRVTDPGWTKLSMAVRESLRNEPKPAMTKVMVTSEGLPAIRLHTQGADFFEKTYFLKRGDPNQKQGEATQGFLQVLTRAPEGADALAGRAARRAGAHVVPPRRPWRTGSPTSSRGPATCWRG